MDCLSMLSKVTDYFSEGLLKDSKSRRILSILNKKKTTWFPGYETVFPVIKIQCFLSIFRELINKTTNEIILRDYYPLYHKGDSLI